MDKIERVPLDLSTKELDKEEGGAREAIEFVLNLSCVHAMTIGMQTQDEVIENVNIINNLME